MNEEGFQENKNSEKCLKYPIESFECKKSNK